VETGRRGCQAGFVSSMERTVADVIIEIRGRCRRPSLRNGVVSDCARKGHFVSVLRCSGRSSEGR